MKEPSYKDKLTRDIISEWQEILNETADIFSVRAGLITCLCEDEIEILLSSRTEGNPYSEGMKSSFPDSGWYCEYTLKHNGLNVIHDASKDEQWKDNAAAVNLNMVSYMGVPIRQPDGKHFGTVCFIDNKENIHNKLHIKLIHQVKRMIEMSLKVISYQGEIQQRDKLLSDLSKIYPICSYCMKIQDESGKWISLEDYVYELSGAMPSHGICPHCYKELNPE